MAETAQPARRGSARPAPRAWSAAPADPAHAPRIAALAAETFPDAWSPAAYRAECQRPDARIWVIHDPGSPATLLGYLSARHALEELHVLSVAVAPAWRGRGIASALLAAALAAAESAGARRALLELRSDDPAARRLYQRQGFVVVGRRRRYYAGGADALLMTRSALTPDRARACAS